VNPVTTRKWDELLLTHPGYTFFHSSSWAKVLSTTYRYTPLYFTSVANGKLEELMPFMEIDSRLTGKRGISLPFTDLCSPLLPAEGGNGRLLDDVIGHGIRSGWRHLEIRGGNGTVSDTPAFSCFYGHHLDLVEDEEVMLSRFRNSTRRNIYKAISDGVKVTIGGSLPEMREFYRLNCMTRKRHGLPPQPYRFFRNLHEQVMAKDHGIVVLASLHDRVIAGAVYLHMGKKAIYKYGASDLRYQSTRANNLVMWEAIRWYASRGYGHFCMGRTESDNDGLRQFKLGWRTREYTIRYYRYDLVGRSFVNSKPGLGDRYAPLFSRLPLPLLRAIGAMAYRHIG
jgi:hypothetical protein